MLLATRINSTRLSAAASLAVSSAVSSESGLRENRVAASVVNAVHKIVLLVTRFGRVRLSRCSCTVVGGVDGDGVGGNGEVVVADRVSDGGNGMVEVASVALTTGS